MRSNALRAVGLLFGAGLFVAVAGASTTANAQSRTASPDELKAARELFQEAYKDEQEQRFGAALEKFQRVAAVKESGSVRYRIGAVLESLGRLRESRDAFRALAASKASMPTAEQEIADSAAERAHVLDKKIPRLVLKVPDNPPADTRITIDGAPVPVTSIPRQVELDPGDHVVQATSPTSQPFETSVTLAASGETQVTVVLAPLAPSPTPTPIVVDGGAPHKSRTLAYVALGAGGVLLVTGVVLLLVREGDVSKIERECVDDRCPPANRASLESAHDEAKLFGPLGVGASLVGLAAAGVGTYLLLRSEPAATPPSAAASASVHVVPARELRVGPRAVPGGAMLGAFATF